jgi:hypothetical protein
MNSDYKDLLSAFNEAGVRYLIVGGYAVIEHTEPRYTKDLDVWIERTPDNADHVILALTAFGAPLRDLSKDDLLAPDTFYQIGLPPNRIDIITQLEEMDFAACWERRKSVNLGELSLHYISVDDLIENKERTARLQDLVDLEQLRESQRLGYELVKPPKIS